MPCIPGVAESLSLITASLTIFFSFRPALIFLSAARFNWPAFFFAAAFSANSSLVGLSRKFGGGRPAATAAT
jgi:hypothetical protein